MVLWFDMDFAVLLGRPDDGDVTMTKTLTAVFDGQVLRPDEPISLTPNTRVRITVEATDAARPAATSFLETAKSLNLDGPSDWSSRMDHYLYGDDDGDIER
jgi:hypothetical protein